MCLIFLLVGCSELESKMCSKECEGKKIAMNDENINAPQRELGKAKIVKFEDEPLVCTLSGPEQLERKGKLQGEIFSQIKKVEEIETGYILSFAYDEEFLIQMTDYVIVENNCCPFFTFEIKLHAKNDALLKITGSKEAKKMLGSVLSENK